MRTSILRSIASVAVASPLLLSVLLHSACVGDEPGSPDPLPDASDDRSSAADASSGGTGNDGGDARDADAATPTGYAATVLADNPVAYWRLAEPGGVLAKNAAATGAAYDLSLDGFSPPDFGQPSLLVNAAGDQALRFTTLTRGSVALGVATAKLQVTTAFTIEAWVRISPSGSGGTIFSSTKAEADGITFTVMGSPGLSIHGRGGLSADTLLVPSDDAPHYVAVAWEGAGSSAAFYVDDKSAQVTGPVGASVNYGPNTVTAWVGAWFDQTQHLAGILDEVAVYGVTLPPSRIAAHRAAGLK